MMNHRGYPRQGAAPSTHFIGSGEAIAHTGSSAIALSGGVLSGDLAVAFSASVSNAEQLTNVIRIVAGTGYAFRVSWVLLNGADQAAQTVTTVGTGSSATTLVGIYRGPTIATNPTFGFNDNTTPSPVIMPGFTKDVAAQALALFCGSPNNPTFLSEPGTFRAITSNGLVALSDFDPASLYTNGTAESWTYTSLTNIFAAPADCH
jgi:hypothetical protein